MSQFLSFSLILVHFIFHLAKHEIVVCNLILLGDKRKKLEEEKGIVIRFVIGRR